MGRRCKNQNKSFSLVEIILVLIIVGILAAFATPSYRKMTEKSRAKNAEFNLIAIYNAQKVHRLAQQEYYGCAAVPCTALELEEELGVYLSDPYFTYNITNTSSTFSAVATRVDGSLCLDMSMSLTQNGSELTKECVDW